MTDNILTRGEMLTAATEINSLIPLSPSVSEYLSRSQIEKRFKEALTAIGKKGRKLKLSPETKGVYELLMKEVAEEKADTDKDPSSGGMKRRA